MIETPKVGVGVFIVNENLHFLVGKRISKIGHGDNQYSLPGGHMEIGETPEESCIREVYEETGLEIEITEKCFIPYSNDIFRLPDRHYITLFFVAKVKGGNLYNLEPNKCEGWEWHTKKTVPRPLFPPLDQIIKDEFFDTWLSSIHQD